MNRSLPCVALLSILASGVCVAAAKRPPMGNPTVILAGAAGQERAVPIRDLRFVSFERIYYNRRAPRSEEPSGRRVEVEDRREECRCIRFEDYAKLKFKKLRQIEITYPADATVARVRLTRLTGEVREVGADALWGGRNPLPPRFSATIDGQLHEFSLIADQGDPPGWPDERLVRILLKRPPPKPAPKPSAKQPHTEAPKGSPR